MVARRTSRVPTFIRVDTQICNSVSPHWRICCDGSFDSHTRKGGWGFVAVPPQTMPSDLVLPFLPRGWGQVLTTFHPLQWGAQQCTNYSAELSALGE
eukprot:2306958-Amphidinium_carterae.1